MPAYQFYDLSGGGAAPEATTEMLLYSDATAIKKAMSPEFPAGCDVWQSHRFVGRFHRAAHLEIEAIDQT